MSTLPTAAPTTSAVASVPSAPGDRTWRLPGLYKPAPRKRAALAAAAGVDADADGPPMAAASAPPSSVGWPPSAPPSVDALFGAPCGRDALFTALDAAVGGDPVRRRLLGHMEALGNAWGAAEGGGDGGGDATAPTPAQVLAAVADAHAAQRMCRSVAAAPPSARLLAAFERARAAAATSAASGAPAPAAASAAVDADGFDVEGDDDDIVPSTASRSSQRGRGKAKQQQQPLDADAYGAALVRSARALAQGQPAGAASKRRRADGSAASSDAPQQQQASYSATDFFGWDPRAGPPPADGAHAAAAAGTLGLRSPWALMADALVHAHRAEAAGLAPLGGVAVTDVLRWLPLFRPYKAPLAELPRAAFTDQCALVTDVVLCLSDGGRLALHPALLPHEFYFLREQLPLHIRARDVALVARGLTCLRVLGCDDDDPLVRLAINWLLATQEPDGSWGGAAGRGSGASAGGGGSAASSSAAASSAPAADPQRAGATTASALLALLVHSHRGYGPAGAGVAALLHAWLADEAAGYATYVASGGPERDAQARADAEAARPASSIALGAAAGRSAGGARRKPAASSSSSAAAAAGSMKARKRRLGEMQKVAHFGPAGDAGMPSAAAAAGGDDGDDNEEEAEGGDAYAHLEQSGLDAFYYGTGKEAGGDEERDRLSDFDDW